MEVLGVLTLSFFVMESVDWRGEELESGDENREGSYEQE